MSKRKRKSSNMQRRKVYIVPRDEYNEAMLSAIYQLGLDPDSSTLFVKRLRKYKDGGGSYRITDHSHRIDIQWENHVI
jgi:hypothetical protein